MNKENRINSEEFFRMMHKFGQNEKITTPSYADLIQAISIIFDINKDDKKKTRPREMSESRSILQRQTIYDETIVSALNICHIEERKHKFLIKCLLKIENILANLKSIPIFSPKSRLHGELCFFWLVTLPQTIEILRFCRDIQKIDFAAELVNYLTSLAQQDKPEKACINMLKDEINELMNNIECPEFKVAISRIDHRSFPKMKSITDILSNLETEISINPGNANAILTKAKLKFIAAKFAFKIFKSHSKNKHLVEIPNEKILSEAHRGLCRGYVCNQYISEYNFEFTHNDNFKFILDLYQKSIRHIDHEDIPKAIKSSPTDLMSCMNRAFLPAAVIAKFYWDLERDRVDEYYIRNFEKEFLATAKNYQYGAIAADIASILLALKIKTLDHLPHRSLEPLAMTLMANNQISNEITFFYDTPFGQEKSIISNTSDFNIALAIFNFNGHIRSGNLTEDLCNPLIGLDEILGYIFEKIDQNNFFTSQKSLPNTITSIKPAKAFTICLYDALKGINGLLKHFNLIESHKGGIDSICTAISLAGDSINRYLRLDTEEMIDILKIIDPERCTKDLIAMQNKKPSPKNHIAVFNKKGYFICNFLVTMNKNLR